MTAPRRRWVRAARPPAAILARQAIAGIDFRLGEKIGIYTEAKYLTSEPEDDVGDNIDVTGTGFFVGLAVGF
jgi:hypothetical protein